MKMIIQVYQKIIQGKNILAMVISEILRHVTL